MAWTKRVIKGNFSPAIQIKTLLSVEGRQLGLLSTRNRSDDLSYKPQVQERARSVTSFYNQSAIDVAAAKVGQLQLTGQCQVVAII